MKMLRKLFVFATVLVASPVFAQSKYNHMTCEFGVCTYTRRFTAPVISTSTPKPIPTPVAASPNVAPVAKKVYRPFTYETPCMLENKGNPYYDTCKVVETRETGGALRTRNIFSNRFTLTIKGRFDKEKGYMTWDNYNNREYKWEYKVGGLDNDGAWTYVMPGFLVQNVSWD